MYLGILVYHVGASLALESALLLAGTIAYVLPLLLVRIAWEERVLREGFGDEYDRYALRVPPLVPLLR
jgi:protein-S-isoprenylcysteine O-methyltransferase Ste14